MKGISYTHSTPEYDNQYFPSDVPFKKGYSKFIDCGAYDGDTIEKLYYEKGKIDTIVAFEPSYPKYNSLIQKIKDSDEKYANNLFTYPCGVYSELKQLMFIGELWEGGRIYEDGESLIQCLPLDYALGNFSPTFIKMDIEGAEYEALLGAKMTIHKFKPDLAICVYHFLSDLYSNTSDTFYNLLIL
jgi:FkbM family methyltransferase